MATENKEKTEIKFEIVKPVKVLSTNPKTSWTKEVNLVKWNDGPVKLDIRDWDPTHTKMGKGITFTDAEKELLKDALNEIE